MSTMDRRKFLKISSLAGLGAVAGISLITGRAAAHSYFLLSEYPEQDAARLTRMLPGLDRFSVTMSKAPVQASAQDLTVIKNGQVIDPRGSDLRREIQDFSRELQKRKNPGHTLVTVCLEQSSPKNTVVFEYNGKIMERLDARKNYDRIEMPGDQGKTLFRLSEGRLSVLESSCRHNLCAKMGPVKSGKIICAPNHLIASIDVGRSKFDGITG